MRTFGVIALLNSEYNLQVLAGRDEGPVAAPSHGVLGTGWRG
jgi:hypothetical protein